MSAPQKPPCGGIGDSETPAAIAFLLGSTITLMFSALFGTLVQAGAGASMLALASQGTWVAAVAGAAFTFSMVYGHYFTSCGSPLVSRPICMSGIVDRVVPAFSNGTDQFFGFTGNHDRIDVVVKSSCWGYVQFTWNPDVSYITCNDDPDRSPVTHGFFHNDEVCAAAKGALVGAVVGGVAGIIIGALVAGLIGCAVTGAAYIACVALVVLVACLVAAAITLIGAIIGAQIGRAVSDDDGAETDYDHLVRVGDLLRIEGPMTPRWEVDGAHAFWFVDTAVRLGHYDGTPPYSFHIADAQIAIADCCGAKPSHDQ